MKSFIAIVLVLLTSINPSLASAEIKASVNTEKAQQPKKARHPAVGSALKYAKEKNYTKAFEYGAIAAKEGDEIGQYLIGIFYCGGKGIKQDYKEAARYFKLAADQGGVFAKSAQCKLGIMYRDGQGVVRNCNEAVRYFKLASDKGYVDAQYNLGIMYRDGKGISKDYKEALRYFKLAADQGDENLYLYLDGKNDPSEDGNMGFSTKSAKAKESYDKLQKFLQDEAKKKLQENMWTLFWFLGFLMCLSLLLATVALMMRYIFRVQLPFKKFLPILGYIFGGSATMMVLVGGFVIIRGMLFGD